MLYRREFKAEGVGFEPTEPLKTHDISSVAHQAGLCDPSQNKFREMNYKSDIEKMEVALQEAKRALEIDEVPIGAAIFDEEDKLIAKSHLSLIHISEPTRR